MEPFSKDDSFHRYENHLPHWNQDGVTYFITFRQNDSIPNSAMAEWKDRRREWIWRHGFEPEGFDAECLSIELKREFEKEFGRRFHELLDAGHGSCLLKNPENAKIIADAFQFFHQERYIIDSFVVMPNHVHLLITPLGEHPLPKILQSLKSFTAKEINKREDKSGQFWQKESYDHIVRSERQLGHYRRYIEANPEKAFLKPGSYLLKMEM